MQKLFFIFLSIMVAQTSMAKPRARDCGLKFPGETGPLNAITDVKGVEVGMTTIIKDLPGKKNKIAVRTGVTVIFPKGKKSPRGVPAGWFSLNGNGEMTGTAWIDESGLLEGPVVLTNTHSVGVVRDAVVEWGLKKFPGTETYSLPVVAETWDGYLSDINGFHVKKDDVFKALNDAKAGPVAEGNVGGGTGMIVCEHKGGTGTASRRTKSGYTVGVLVQANYGSIEDLYLLGVPIGYELGLPHYKDKKKDGSIIIVIATDAPLLPHQLKRVVRRANLGLGRAGSVSRNSSGDLFVAFSTVQSVEKNKMEHWTTLPNDNIDEIFEASVHATEEAIANVLFAAETMTGLDGLTIPQIPVDKVLDILSKKTGQKMSCGK